LVRLQAVLPVGVSLEDLKGRAADGERLAGLFRRWGFRGLLAEAEERMQNAEGRMQNEDGDARGAEKSVVERQAMLL
jgi:hypothetical protein